MINANCINCDRSISFEYLLYPLVISVFWVLYITLTTSDKHRVSTTREQTGKCRFIQSVLSKKKLMMMIKTMCNRNILYYEQALSQTLSEGSYIVFLSIFSNIFDLSIANNAGTSKGGWCFIDGLDSKHKILLNLISPMIIVSILVSIYFISKCRNHTQIISKRTFVTTVLLLIGNILSTLFKLLDCKNIGGTAYHFYFAYEKCYGATWILALLSLIIIVVSFSFIFIKLKRMTMADRQNPSNGLSSLITKFKPQYYYWEYVLFIRRVIIAFFAASAFDNNYKLVFIMILLVFLYIQYQCESFIVHEGNKMEFILLLFLVFVLVLDMTSFINPIFEQYLIAGSILFPFISFAYFMMRYATNPKMKTQEEIGKNGISMDYLDASEDVRNDDVEMMLDQLINAERKLSLPLQKITVNSDYHIIEDHEEVNHEFQSLMD